MAWQRCAKHLIQSNILPQKLAAQGSVSSLMTSTLASSIFQPRAWLGRQQRQRYLHNRVQSAWDAAKMNVARVPSILPSRQTTPMSFCRKTTTVVVLGIAGIGGLHIYNTYLIFQQCSNSKSKILYKVDLFVLKTRRATYIDGANSVNHNHWRRRLTHNHKCQLEKMEGYNVYVGRALKIANNNVELRAIVGDNIELGPWYETSMSVDHEIHSTMCNFAIVGSVGSALIHFRAARYEGTKGFTSYFELPGSAKWELLILEAWIYRPREASKHIHPQRINLL